MFNIRHLASYYDYPNEWEFSVNKVSDTEYRVYPARDDKGNMFDITRRHRYQLGLVAKFDHFPTWDEVFEAAKDWHCVMHPTFAFLEKY